ncbi:MAG: 2,3,4,5-tetrahydropyridine-2,6-dicarboxylate N-succinyltransferase [Deltaproteobacteria bacterium]
MEIKNLINEAYDNRSMLQNPQYKEAVEEVFSLLDQGKVRAAEKSSDGKWTTNEWVKKAILMYFGLSQIVEEMAGPMLFKDKIPLKTKNLDGVRVVPPSAMRYGSFAEAGTIMMAPAYVNTGAYVAAGTMIDSFTLVGSCAQIGKNCHISAHVTVGGVLEPPQASPVIIEDNCFVGANSSIVEGVMVEEGSVISSGVNLTASTKIYDVRSGEKVECPKGRIPPYVVVIPGMVETAGGIFAPAAIIRKDRDRRTDLKTSLEDALR